MSCLILLLTAQIVPTSFTLIAEDVSLINGSSLTRPCSRNGETLNCTDPASSTSVLFDGHIPTLTGLDNHTWASQLLTLRPTNASTEITFNFTDNIDFVRVEVMMFNCPQWEIGVQNIAVRENMTDILSKQTGNITSCEYLVKTCIMAPFSSPSVLLKFNLPTTSRWVHLAEVTVHNNTSECPPDTIITRAEATTTTTPATTTPNTDGSRTAAITTAGNPAAETTSETTQTDASGFPVTIIIITAIPALVLILIVAVAVILLCCWRSIRRPHTLVVRCQHTHNRPSTYRR